MLNVKIILRIKNLIVGAKQMLKTLYIVLN